MQTCITTTSKQCDENRWVSIIPSLISTSMGGAVIGGSLAHISGALVGGAFGVFIAICSEFSIGKRSTSKN